MRWGTKGLADSKLDWSSTQVMEAIRLVAGGRTRLVGEREVVYFKGGGAPRLAGARESMICLPTGARLKTTFDAESDLTAASVTSGDR